MNRQSLAVEIWSQVQQIASARGLVRVTRIDLTVGRSLGLPADALAVSFVESFRGSGMQGADLHILIVDAGQPFLPPDCDEQAVANGFELLVTRIEGQEW